LEETLRTTSGTITLRREQPGDAAFLYSLFRSHALPGLAGVPCDESGREALVRMQFEAQTIGYRRQFPDAGFAILEHAGIGAPVGRIIIQETSDGACIVDFALLPAVQGGGLGTAISARHPVGAGGTADDRAMSGHVQQYSLVADVPAGRIRCLRRRTAFSATGVASSK
jgi:hypothetical protein